MKLDPAKFLPEVIGIAVIAVFGLFLGSLSATLIYHLPLDYLLSTIASFLALVILWLFSKVISEILVELREINKKLNHND